MKESEDNNLVAGSLRGETRAFEKLVRKYQRMVFNVIYQVVRDFSDTEDLTQSVFVKVYENLEKFDYRHKFYSWLYRIAINEALNFIQQKKVTYEIPEDYQSMDKTPDLVLNESEMVENIDRALAELDPNYRVLIVMRHFLDYSYKEIADVVRLPEQKVKSRLYMARQILARLILEKGMRIDEQ
jgi:RNA polymerase sigma-70 factor (ECF subfamily)